MKRLWLCSYHFPCCPFPVVALRLPLIDEREDPDLPWECTAAVGNVPRPRNRSKEHHLRNVRLVLHFAHR